MMIRKAMVIPLGAVARTIPGSATSVRVNTRFSESPTRKAVRKPGPCRHRHQPRTAPSGCQNPAGQTNDTLTRCGVRVSSMS